MRASTDGETVKGGKTIGEAVQPGMGGAGPEQARLVTVC